MTAGQGADCFRQQKETGLLAVIDDYCVLGVSWEMGNVNCVIVHYVSRLLMVAKKLQRTRRLLKSLQRMVTLGWSVEATVKSRPHA